MSSWTDNIEDSEIDKYIETHFAVMKENLDIAQKYFRFAMKDARNIEQLLKKNRKTFVG